MGFLFYSLIYILMELVVILLYVLQFCMFGRALMSWFSPDDSNGIARFLTAVTEPFVHPIRQLLNKFDLFSGIPIDMSFMVAFIVLIICTTMLTGVSL